MEPDQQKNQISIERLRKLEPIASLSSTRIEELVALSYVERLGVGVCLFREGDVDNQTVYLLNGDVQLSASDGSVDRVVTSKMAEAKFPLDDKQPKQVTAVALSNVEILRIDNNILDYVVTWDQLTLPDPPPRKPKSAAKTPSPAEAPVAAPASVDTPASEGPRKGEWVGRMKHIMAFRSMPPANVKALLERMEPMEVKAGDVVVRQGDSGDFYYVLTKGKAAVTRTVELAELEAGAAFGEEALISGGERNATVTMETDGTVMRLSKQDFDALLREPLVNWVSPEEARKLLMKGARWLDVRHPREFQHQRLPGAINIPLHELRANMGELNPEYHYVCYCKTGRRSSAAAFLLSQKGYKASVLRGGLQVLPHGQEKAKP